MNDSYGSGVTNPSAAFAVSGTAATTTRTTDFDSSNVDTDGSGDAISRRTDKEDEHMKEMMKNDPTITKKTRNTGKCGVHLDPSELLLLTNDCDSSTGTSVSSIGGGSATMTTTTDVNDSSYTNGNESGVDPETEMTMKNDKDVDVERKAASRTTKKTTASIRTTRQRAQHGKEESPLVVLTNNSNNSADGSVYNSSSDRNNHEHDSLDAISVPNEQPKIRGRKKKTNSTEFPPIRRLSLRHSSQLTDTSQLSPVIQPLPSSLSATGRRKRSTTNDGNRMSSKKQQLRCSTSSTESVLVVTTKSARCFDVPPPPSLPSRLTTSTKCPTKQPITSSTLNVAVDASSFPVVTKHEYYYNCNEENEVSTSIVTKNGTSTLVVLYSGGNKQVEEEQQQHNDNAVQNEIRQGCQEVVDNASSSNKVVDCYLQKPAKSKAKYDINDNINGIVADNNNDVTEANEDETKRLTETNEILLKSSTNTAADASAASEIITSATNAGLKSIATTCDDATTKKDIEEIDQHQEVELVDQCGTVSGNNIVDAPLTNSSGIELEKATTTKANSIPNTEDKKDTTATTSDCTTIDNNSKTITTSDSTVTASDDCADMDTVIDRDFRHKLTESSGNDRTTNEMRLLFPTNNDIAIGGDGNGAIKAKKQCDSFVNNNDGDSTFDCANTASKKRVIENGNSSSFDIVASTSTHNNNDTASVSNMSNNCDDKGQYIDGNVDSNGSSSIDCDIGICKTFDDAKQQQKECKSAMEFVSANDVSENVAATNDCNIGTGSHIDENSATTGKMTEADTSTTRITDADYSSSNSTINNKGVAIVISSPSTLGQTRDVATSYAELMDCDLSDGNKSPLNIENANSYIKAKKGVVINSNSYNKRADDKEAICKKNYDENDDQQQRNKESEELASVARDGTDLAEVACHNKDSVIENAASTRSIAPTKHTGVSKAVCSDVDEKEKICVVDTVLNSNNDRKKRRRGWPTKNRRKVNCGTGSSFASSNDESDDQCESNITAATSETMEESTTLSLPWNALEDVASANKLERISPEFASGTAKTATTVPSIEVTEETSTDPVVPMTLSPKLENDKLCENINNIGVSVDEFKQYRRYPSRARKSRRSDGLSFMMKESV